MMNKRLLITFVFIASLCLVLSGYSESGAKGAKRLTFANWLPPMNPVSKGFDEWAREFENRTGGRYKVEVVHGGVLGGPPQTYDITVSGVADICAIITQDVEKPFPLTTIAGLPFAHTSADVFTKAWYNNVYKKGYLDRELSDVKVLFQFTAAGEDFLTTKPLNKLTDLKGFKVAISGGPTKSRLTKDLGAVGVFGTPPDIYMMLQKGVANGVMITSLGIKDFHWDDFIKYNIDPLRVGMVVWTIAMNKDSYNKFPDDVKATLEDMHGDGKWAFKQSMAFENMYQSVVKDWLGKGGKVITWSEKELKKLNEIAAPIWEDYISAHEAEGVPVRKVINELYNGLKALGVDNPALGYTPGG
jgi:TRAP-type C4-dicarboxylate transport system substrate-binding protein